MNNPVPLLGVIVKTAVATDTYREVIGLQLSLNLDLENNTVLWFSRTTTPASKGKWVEGFPTVSTENLVGLPIVIPVTETDIHGNAGVESTGSPTAFGQKASRKADGQTVRTNIKAQPVLTTIHALLKTKGGDHIIDEVRSLNEPAVVSAPAISVQPVPAVSAPAVPSNRSVRDLSHYTPALDDPKVSGYINRTIGGVTDGEWAEYAVATGRNMAIDGEAGTGKTSFARWVSAQRGVPFVTVPCHQQLDSLQVEGGFIPTEAGLLVWADSEFAQAYQQPSVILLNESSRMKPAQNAYFMSALEEGILVMGTHEGEVLHKHPECLIITDYNSGYAGTVSHDEAFLDRFAVKLMFEYDTALEANFIKSTSLLELAKQVRAQRGDVFTHTPFSTRLLKYFEEQALFFGKLEPAVFVLLQSFIDPIERASLKNLVEAHRYNIADELGVEA